jgi:DNA-binding transcriptional ArsR family regulator
MSPLDATFGALADPTRRGVIELLKREPRRASDLADELGASRPAMSRHLRVLRKSGLVETTADDTADDARERVYRLKRERFGELREWLDEVEASWNDQLAAFAAHVARKHAKK